MLEQKTERGSSSLLLSLTLAEFDEYLTNSRTFNRRCDAPGTNDERTVNSRRINNAVAQANDLDRLCATRLSDTYKLDDPSIPEAALSGLSARTHQIGEYPVSTGH